ncbi:MAG: hypothetical protein KatS3mg051_2319 [Anaerolineae bacterium]|nr:MAG: hypothetical protein KatS3mg051_2319 [Anaerolineae bacterium]
MRLNTIISLTLVVALSVLALAAPARPVHAAGGRCYVNDDATGANNGNSWTDAYTSLQSALADSNCTEIWVAAGVYYPGSAGNQTATFTLKNNVAIYGGFAGTETLLSQRNWRSNLTILSGDIDKNDTDTNGNGIIEKGETINGANAYHVVTSPGGTNSSAVLDGFVITAGRANGSSFPNYSGGGMYNQSSSPTLRNLTFSGNSAASGGGMYNYSNSSPTLTNVAFSGNSATNGGGMLNESNSNPTLTNVTFSGNSAGGDGGGMYNLYSSNPTLTNVTFSGNSAASGGGMSNYRFQQPDADQRHFQRQLRYQRRRDVQLPAAARS